MHPRHPFFVQLPSFIRRAAPVTLACAALLFASGRGEAAGSLPGYVVLPLVPVGPHAAGLRASIDGHPITLIVDTGASHTVLDRRFYKGIVTSATTANDNGLPANFPKSIKFNGVSAELGQIQNLQAGGMSFGNGPCFVMDLSVVSKANREYNTAHPNYPVGGLIGEDILGHYAAIIDWPRHGIYFNTDPSKRLKLGPGLVAAGWTALPMERTSGRHFAVSSTVNGKPYQMMVDTGAGFSIVDVNQLSIHDMSYAAGVMPMQMIGSSYEGRPVYLKDWMLGSYRVPEVTVVGQALPDSVTHESSAAHGPMLGLLGREVLARNSAIIDISGSTLYVKPASDSHASPKQHAPASGRKTVMLTPHGNALVDADGDLDAAGIVRVNLSGHSG